MRIDSFIARMSGRSKFFATLAVIAGVASVLFYIEQLAIFYILISLLAFVFLILAAFPDLEDASIHASEEAYQTGKSEGAFEKSAAILKNKPGAWRAAGKRAAHTSPPLAPRSLEHRRISNVHDQ